MKAKKTFPKTKNKRLRRGGPRKPPSYWLYGNHCVLSALSNTKRKIQRLICFENKYSELSSYVDKLIRVENGRLNIEIVTRSYMEQCLGKDVVHQGVAALVEPLPSLSVEDISYNARIVLILDHVTDPRNVGSILRSAAAFNCDGVIVQQRHAPYEDGALAKAASGGLECVPLIREVNLARSIEKLKKKKFWVVGLQASEHLLDGSKYKGEKIALVLGAEGEGLRPLVKEHCDDILGLYMPGGMESLNVSVAAAIGLYEIVRYAL